MSRPRQASMVCLQDMGAALHGAAKASQIPKQYSATPHRRTPQAPAVRRCVASAARKYSVLAASP